MTQRKAAGLLIGGILAVGTIVLGGLHYFAEHGQFTPPSSATNGAQKSDQKPGAPLRADN